MMPPNPNPVEAGQFNGAGHNQQQPQQNTVAMAMGGQLMGGLPHMGGQPQQQAAGGGQPQPAMAGQPQRPQAPATQEGHQKVDGGGGDGQPPKSTPTARRQEGYS
jgi:hypothetical protein